MAVGSDYPGPTDFFFFFPPLLPAVIFSIKDCCQHLSGRLCEAHFSFFFGGGLGPDRTGGKNKERIDRTVEIVTAMLVDDGFTLETIWLWGI